MKNNFWKIATVVAVLFSVWLGCFRKPRPADSDLVAKNDSLVRKVKDDSAARRVDSALYAARIAVLQQAKKEQVAKLNNSETLLYQSQGTINNLVTQLRAAKQKPYDNTFIPVARAYIDACDSLALTNEYQGRQLAEAKKDKDDIIDLMTYETGLRDSMLTVEAGRYNELRNDFNAQTHFFQLAIKSGKPKTKVYAGMSVLGNTTTILGGGEASIMLVTKKDQVFEVGGGFFGKDWYGRVGYKIKIKL